MAFLLPQLGSILMTVDSGPLTSLVGTGTTLGRLGANGLEADTVSAPLHRPSEAMGAAKHLWKERAL